MGEQAKLKHLKFELEELLAQVYGGEVTPVFGEGRTRQGVMLVGEAPGEQETLQKRPFVGKAGKNLDEFLAMADLEREELYITNVVKFRPVRVNAKTGRKSNRPPTREEILLCLPFLEKEIAIVRPRVIVTLGNVALRAVTGNGEATIGQCHGRLTTGCGATTYPLYHPASLIYNPALRETYRQDVEKLAQWLKNGE